METAGAKLPLKTSQEFPLTPKSCLDISSNLCLFKLLLRLSLLSALIISLVVWIRQYNLLIFTMSFCIINLKVKQIFSRHGDLNSIYHSADRFYCNSTDIGESWGLVLFKNLSQLWVIAVNYRHMFSFFVDFVSEKPGSHTRDDGNGIRPSSALYFYRFMKTNPSRNGICRDPWATPFLNLLSAVVWSPKVTLAELVRRNFFSDMI